MLNSGQLCCVKALQIMKQEYTNATSRKPSSISPYPFLAALSGQFNINFLSNIIILHILNIDISPSFERGQQADANELYLKLLHAILEKYIIR